ncbi:WD40 repeat-like protein [Calocera viscosa TUFC12733]|uniref:WD40 repeat-like protein n=1 Tax=Calocera viscosa (strain TUFC12733) TaxID=1330018 RepID=A0A167LQF4_CALVF|nr:WD40 repeat-like protein [Calocera viscosa TUFC12733]
MVGVDEVDAGDKAKQKNAKGKAVQKDGKRWDWVSLLDAKTSDHPAIFTKDARFFFLPSGTSVHIHSASTGEVVSTLAAPHSPGKASKQRVTSLVLNPSNPFQLLVAHLDGNLRVWDFLDGVLLRTVEVGHGITHMCVNENLKDQVVVAVTEVGKKGSSDAHAKPQSVLYRVTLSTQTKTYISKLPIISYLAISHSAQHLVGTSGSTCHVVTLPAEGDASVLRCPSKDKITCLVFHPEEEWFATGDEIGTIKFWYCSSSAGQGTAQLHTASHLWHAHPVRSLTFTPNGAYLLSGGEEAVVVAWQLHSGLREFVPRVGGPIRWMSVRPAEGNGEEEWLAGLADRTLVWVNAGSLKVSRSVARVKLDISAPSSALPTSLPLAVHPITSNLLLPSSHPSFLQIYSHPNRSLITELEVHPSNRVSKPNPDASPLPTARVERVAISPQGNWMATIDVRRGGEELDLDVDRAVTRLKVWRWNGQRKEWELNTRVERPHGTGEVTSLAWMPEPPLGSGKAELGCLLATTGKDGNVKTWRARVGRGEEGEEEVAWINRSSFSYRAHVPQACAFSPDGSLLAVGQGPCVTLWDPKTNVMQRVLAGVATAVAEQVAFVGRDGRWVAVLESRPEGASGKRKVRRNVLVLWDLLSCTASWEYDLGICSAQVVPQPSGAFFAVFASTDSTPTPDRSTRAFLFNTASSRPFRIQKLSFKLQNTISYPLAPSTPGASELSFVGITKDMDVVLFGDSVGELEKRSPGVQKLGAAAPAARTLFQEVFGISALVDPDQEHGRPVVALDSALQKGDDSLFDGPAYMLPAMSTLFQPFMDSILKRRSAEPAAETIQQAPVEEAAPAPTKKRPDLPPRVVDQKEFETFVELFIELSHAPARPQPPSTPIANGNGKPRGKATNGSTPRSTRRTPAKVLEDVVMEVDLPTPTPRAEESGEETAPGLKSVVPRKRGRKSSL